METMEEKVKSLQLNIILIIFKDQGYLQQNKKLNNPNAIFF